MANDAVPEDVARFAMERASHWAENGQVNRHSVADYVAAAIMADRATRPSREDVLADLVKGEQRQTEAWPDAPSVSASPVAPETVEKAGVTGAQEIAAERLSSVAALRLARGHLVNITGGDPSMVPQSDQDAIDAAIASPASPSRPVEAVPVAWMHPTAGWAREDRNEVLAHCFVGDEHPKPMPLYLHPAPPHTAPEGMVLVPQSALDWLLGSGPDASGKWFSEVEDATPTMKALGDRRPAFWWRAHFRSLVPALVAAPKEEDNAQG